MAFDPDVKPDPWEKSQPLPPLVLLRDTERSLRLRTLEVVTPVLPGSIASTLGEASIVADTSLDALADIDLDSITPAELKPARIYMGLTFVGFGALALVFLLLYLSTLHPELSAVAQIQHYWYQYICCVCIGIAGMFMLGREAMRS